VTIVFGKRTYLMGVLNVTPDSFSDGGRYDRLESAVAQAHHMAEAGADILDIGGQSTRPGAETVPLAEELRRVLPVITRIRSELSFTLPISVDTTRSEVAAAALEAGATWINDISGGTYDPRILKLAAQWQVPIVLMHLRGTPQTMQGLTVYEDVVSEVASSLGCLTACALAEGIGPAQIILDPGIGFAKTPAQNLVLLRRLPELKALGYPLLVGPSRKSFIGNILNQPDPLQRVWGTAAACCGAIAGGADILRVHDVAQMRDVCRVADALWR
jgi:dihydropteroate synthase